MHFQKGVGLVLLIPMAAPVCISLGILGVYKSCEFSICNLGNKGSCGLCYCFMLWFLLLVFVRSPMDLCCFKSTTLAAYAVAYMRMSHAVINHH